LISVTLSPDWFRYQNPDKPACTAWQPEVVDVLFNRDLNLLCRIEEMRKAQIAEKEDRQLRKWKDFTIR
jgi:hypothetical protein